MKSSACEYPDDSTVPGRHPDGYLPYQMDITKSVAEYAEKRLDETPEWRTRCLKEVRERLKREEKGLRFRDEDNSLLKFLRARKFDVKRAVAMVKRYYAFLEAHRDVFDRSNPTFVERFVQANVIGPLPYRDPKGRAIVVIRADGWDPKEFPPDDAVFGGMVAMRHALEMPVNQIMGFMVIFDMKGLSVEQILAFVPKYIVFAFQGLQHCCPCKVCQIHVVNFPGIFRIAWNVIKPLVSEKIKSRIIFHKKKGFESLHKVFPKAILPEELGGDLGPMDNSHWGKDAERMQREYTEEVRYGYTDWSKGKNSEKINPIISAGITLLEKIKSGEVTEECLPTDESLP